MRLLHIPTVLLACSGETEKTDDNSAPIIQSLSITGDTFSTSDTLPVLFNIQTKMKMLYRIV